MKSLSLELDAAVLARCTKFSHGLQRKTGLTNFFVAKIGLFLMALGMIVNFLNYFNQFLVHKTRFWELCLLGPFFFGLVGITFFCNKAEDETLSDERTKSPIAGAFDFFPILRYLRLAFMGMLLLDCLVILPFIIFRTTHPFLEICAACFDLGYVVTTYFLEVDPLPPGKNPIKEWLANRLATKKLVPVPVRVER